MQTETSVHRHSYFDPSRLPGSLLIGLVAGGAAGLAAGVAARGAMRGVALLSGQAPGFSLEGTLFILMLGAMVGTILGLFYAFTLPVWPGSFVRKGLVLGGLLALLIVFAFLFSEQEGELALVPGWAAAALFAPIPLIYGAVLGLVARRLVPAELERPAVSPAFLRGVGLLTAAGGLASALIELFFAIAFPAARLTGVAVSLFLSGAAGAAFLVTAGAGLAGLLRSRAAGDGKPVTFGLGIALLIVLMFGLVSVFGGMGSVGLHGLIRLVERLQFDTDQALLLLPVAAAVMFVLAAGVSVLRVRRWHGWRAYAPLAVGVVPFLGFLLLHPALFPALAGLSAFERVQLGHWVGGLYGLAWLALGLALRAEAER